MLIVLGWIWLGMLICLGALCIGVVVTLALALFEGFSKRW